MIDQKEQKEINKLIAQFFDAFDNREGKTPTLSRLSTFFTEKAIVLQNQNAVLSISTVAEFAAPRINLLNSGKLIEFHEWETTSVTNVHGSFAIHVSEYEKAGISDDQPYAGGGTKIFSLVKVNRKWRIACLSWFDRCGLPEE